MNRLMLILTFIIVLCLPYSALPQGTWKYYTRADGLAGDSVIAITQDKLGNMWFGTYLAGLSKLDTTGVWTNFFTSRDCTVSITDFEVDNSNNIWMILFQLGIYYQGYYVVKYNGSIFYYYEDPDGEPLRTPSPTTLGQDTSGYIWCGSTEGGVVYRFDGESWQWRYIPGAGAAGHGLISDIETDRYGTLYFAHHGGISTLMKWIRYFYWAFDIAFDRLNRLWFCSYEPGWFFGMFDGENWHTYITDQKIVSRVAVDSTNNIWLNYYINGGIQGAAKFDGANFTFFNSENGLAQDRVNEIYVDRKGDIWFASDAGISVLHDTTTTRVKQQNIPIDEKMSFALSKNYPNPFNSSTIIAYSLSQAGAVELKIYNFLAKEVRTLINQYQEKGEYEVIWNGKDKNLKEVVSGIYIAVLKCGDFKKSIKLNLIR